MIFMLFSLWISQAQAVQLGKVVVDQALVHENPQLASPVISKIAQNETLQFSNFPTEGFYRVRLKDGTLGWVSKNDILLGLPNEVAQPKVPQAPQTKTKTVATRRQAQRVEIENPLDSDFHLILTYGLTSLSYAGLDTNFTGVSALNRGKDYSIEIQWRKSESLFWATRLEYLKASAGPTLLSTGITQTLSQTVIPLQLGLVYSAVDGRRFHLGIGTYLGLAISSTTTVEQNPASGAGAKNDYATNLDPCFTLGLQSQYRLSKTFWTFVELAYRYEKTSTFDAAPLLGTTDLQAFSINYSGLIARLGVELRF